MAVVGAFCAIATLIVFLQGLADVYKAAVIISALILLASLLVVKEHIAPKGELAELTKTLRLAVHLDQILKQASEIMLLSRLLEKQPDDRLVKDLASDDATVLKYSIDSVEELVKQLSQDQKLEGALEDIHIDDAMLERRVKLGK